MKKVRRGRDLPEPSDETRRRFSLVMWAVFLVVVVFVAANILPIGSRRPSSAAHESFEIAAQMESEGLAHAAANVYRELMEDARQTDAVRARAAESLAGVYLNRLDDPQTALPAMETAYYYASGEERRERLRNRIEVIRKEIESRRAPDPLVSERLSDLPEGATVIARIGGQEVTLEEILYAWNRYAQGREPTGEDLQQFTREYLSRAAMAEEARRRGLDGDAALQMEMRMNERDLLAEALLHSIAPEISEEDVRNHYDEHREEFMRPEAARVGHILVDSREQAEQAGERLKRGEPFESVARDLSRDREALPEATQIGWVAADAAFIPHVGSMPGLGAKLTKLDEGATTGPIEGPRGWHWFRVEEKRPPEPKAFEEVREKIRERLTTERFREERRKLMEKLDETMPREMYPGQLKKAMADLRERMVGADDAERPDPETSAPDASAGP